MKYNESYLTLLHFGTIGILFKIKTSAFHKRLEICNCWPSWLGFLSQLKLLHSHTFTHHNSIKCSTSSSQFSYHISLSLSESENMMVHNTLGGVVMATLIFFVAMSRGWRFKLMYCRHVGMFEWQINVHTIIYITLGLTYYSCYAFPLKGIFEWLSLLSV